MKIHTSLTDADIVAWFKAKRDEAGIRGLSLGLGTGYHKPFVARTDNIDEPTQFGDTLAEAIEAVRKGLEHSATKAARLRQQAKVLLAQAEALEPSEPALS